MLATVVVVAEEEEEEEDALCILCSVGVSFADTNTVSINTTL